MTMDAFKCPVSALPRWWVFTDFGQSSRFLTLWKQLVKKKCLSAVPNKIPNINRTILANVTGDPERLSNQSPITFLSCSGVGLPAGLLRLCGVLLHPAGEEPGDPTAHGLPTQPHHTQYDRGKYYGSILIFFYCLPTSTPFLRCTINAQSPLLTLHGTGISASRVDMPHHAKWSVDQGPAQVGLWSYPSKTL